MFNEFDAFMFGPYGISVIDNFDKQFEALEKFVVEQEKKSNPFGIQCVQSNREKGVFTVKWTDGTVTMVTCQPGDDWDDEKALAMCFMKKAWIMSLTAIKSSAWKAVICLTLKWKTIS